MLRFWATIIGCCLLVARRVISQLPEDCDYVGYTTTYIAETGNQSFTTLTPVGICLISTQQYWDSPVFSTLMTCAEDGTVYQATYVGVADCTGTPLEIIAVSDQYSTYAAQASTHNVSLSAVSQCATGNVCPHRIVRSITPLEGADADCSESGKTPVDGQEYYDEASILDVCNQSPGVSSWSHQTACNAEGLVTLTYYVGSDSCDAGAQGVTLQTQSLGEVGTFDYCDTYGSTVVQSVSCEATPVQFAGPQSVEIAPLDTLDCDFFSLAVSGPALAFDNSTYNFTSISHWPLNICVTETQLSGLDGSTVTGHRSHIVCENGEIFFKQYNLADTDCSGLALHSFPFAEYLGFDEADAGGYSVSITANCDTGNICDHAIFREFDDASDCSAEASTPTESDVYTEVAKLVGACDIFPVSADGSYAYADVCEGDRLFKYGFIGEECSGVPFAIVYSATPGEYAECDAGYTKNVLVSASCETTTTATTTTLGPGTGGTTSTTSSADTTTTVAGGGNGTGSGATTAVSSFFVTFGVIFAYIFFLS